MPQFDMFTIITIALVAMMGFSIFSQRKRAKQIEEMRSKVSEGDKIFTIGGFVGTIVEVTEDEFVLDCEGTRMRIKKWAVHTVQTRANESLGGENHEEN